MYKMMQTYCRGKKETDFGNQSKHISNNPLNCYSDQKHKTVTFIRFIFFHYFSDYNVSAKPLSFVAQNFTIFVIVRNTSLSDNVAKLMDHEKLCVGFVYFLQLFKKMFSKLFCGLRRMNIKCSHPNFKVSRIFMRYKK